MLARRIVIASAVLAACTGLKSAENQPVVISPDGSTPNGTSDAGDDDDGGAVVNLDASVLAPPDAGRAPEDFECDKDEWTKPTKTQAECSDRRVYVVETASTIDTNGVSIARTPAGRVGISYNTENSESGALHLAHFLPKTDGFAKPEIVLGAAQTYEHAGFMSRLGATAPDTLQLLTYDVDDIDSVGKLHFSTLVGGKKPLTDQELVAAGLPRPSEIAFAVAPDGSAYALARLATGTAKAKIIARRRELTGTWGDLPDVPELGGGLLPQEAPGVGSAWLHLDPAGQLHLLYHHNEVMQHSTPRYHVLANAKWTFRKTIDNNVVDGLSGFSPRIVTFSTRKYALYFFRKALQDTGATADLRLATWIDTEKPTVEIIDQGIPSAEPLRPRYRAAMAIDKYGLIHLAIVRPSGANRASLDYKRQARIASGGTKWLTDVVAPEVLSEQSDAFVDILVDENARPHIAYRSGADSKVYYATRFDR